MTAAAPATARPEPWRAGDVTVVAAGVFVGGTGLGGAWFGISGTTDLHRQVLWLDVGVTAVLLGSAACACWLLAGHRAVRTRSRVLRSALDVGRRVEDGSASRLGPIDAHDLVAIAAGTRFHRTSCQLVTGRAVLTATVAGHVAAGRSPCGVCEPPATHVDP